MPALSPYILARGVDLGATPLVGGGKVRLDVFEFGVGKTGGVGHNGPKRKPSSLPLLIYQTVSGSSTLAIWE